MSFRERLLLAFIGALAFVGFIYIAGIPFAG